MDLKRYYLNVVIDTQFKSEIIYNSNAGLAIALLTTFKILVSYQLLLFQPYDCKLYELINESNRISADIGSIIQISCLIEIKSF